MLATNDWQPLLNVLDAVLKEILCEDGKFMWHSQDEPNRRRMWDEYVTCLADRVAEYVEKHPTPKLPVNDFPDRIVGVLTWPPYETSPPPPFFGRTLLECLFTWTMDYQQGIREVRRLHVYILFYLANVMLL
jgi:hypothetical protein